MESDSLLRKLYTQEWRWRDEQFGDVGSVQKDASVPFMDHLPKVDGEAQDTRLRRWQAVLVELAHIEPHRLSASEQVNYQVYRHQIEGLIANQVVRDYEMPANADSAFWFSLEHVAGRPFCRAEDYRNWIAQMRDIPRYFREQMDQMRAGMRRGFTPPQITMRGRDRAISAVAKAMPERTFFYGPFKQMSGVSAEAQGTLREQAVRAIREVVQPAYEELLEFLRAEYFPGLRTTIAARDLPDGEAYYRAKVREFTTLDLEPAEIHELGLEAVTELQAEMNAVKKEAGFSGDLPAFLTYLRNDPRFYAKTPEELLMRAAWIAKTFDGKASQFFERLPRGRFAIRAVPEELAPFYTAGRGLAGLYLLNTYQLESRPLYNLVALTLHESAPGHAFQLALAMEHTAHPEFRRSTYLSAYGEGWALYCEKLGVEMGMYETPYDRFGMLGYQIWRAARLVVDTGLHAYGWSRQEALDYLRAHTALADHEVQTEIDRYISWPAQALSYYIGERSILRARARAEHALGARFNLRSFHDTVLDLGSVPLSTLDARIDSFITDGDMGTDSAMERAQ